MDPAQPYFPFEPFLADLQEDGLRLGTDSYLAVQELLAYYARQAYFPDSDTLKAQLSAILVSSAQEAQIFETRFEAYLSKYAISYPPDDEETGEITPPPRRFPWIYLLALLPLILALAWLLLRQDARVHIQQRGGIQAQPDSTYHHQTLRLRGQDAYAYPDWTLRDAPEPAQWIWTLPDGDTVQGIQPVHHFEEPGSYPVSVQAIFPTGDTLRTRDTIKVRPIERLQTDFSFLVGNGTGAPIQFEEQVKSYSGEARRPWDTLIEPLRFRWDLGELGRFDGRQFSVTPTGDLPDTARFRLIVTARWRDTTVVDTVDKEALFYVKPDLPSLKKYLLPVNIQDLIKPQGRDNWRWVLLLSLLLGYLILEAIVSWRRQVLLDESPKRGPPFREELDLPMPPLDYFHTQPFYLITRQLRQRRIGGLRPRPDVRRSIQRTIDAGGFPSIEFGIRTEASQYLLLIEQHSPEDHLARLYAELGRELASRDISVEVWFYHRSPELCWRAPGKRQVPLQRLRNLYPGYRLLLIGDGTHFLSRDGQGLADWTDELTSWDERAFLSTRPTESWGPRERLIHPSMLVVPATETGLIHLVEQWMAEEKRSPAEWKRDFYAPSVPRGEALKDPVELRAYLGQAAFNWLGACAWYPETSWGLTLRFARRLQQLPAATPRLQLDLDTLVRLFRLPFFREGRMPRALREKLVSRIPDPINHAARDLLIDLLQEPHHQAPEDSYAEADQQVRLALFRYLNSPRDREAREALRQQLLTVHPDDIEDHLSLHELGKIRSPLSLPLPARMFWGNIPLLGLKQQIRMPFWITLFCLLMAGNYWWQNREEMPPWDSGRSYTASELNLESAADSARWYTHEGIVVARQDSLNPFQPELRYFDLALSADPGLDTARYNQALTFYARGRRQYDADSLRYLPAIRYPENPDSIWAIPQVWMPLANAFVSHLQKDGQDIRYLLEALCGPTADSLYQKQVRDSLLREPDFLRLLDRLEGAERGELLDCLGQPPPDSLRPVYLHLRILDGSTGEPVQAAVLQITNADDLRVDASGRIFYRYERPPATRIPGQISLAIQAEGYFREGHELRLWTDSTQVQTIRLRRNQGNLRLSADLTEGCVPLTVRLQATTDKVVTSYAFGVNNSFSDFSPAAEQSFDITRSGRFDITVRVAYWDGMRDTLTLEEAISAGSKPDIQMVAEADPLVPQKWIFFPAGTDVDSFRLDLGDGQTLRRGVEQPFEHLFGEPGSYRLILVGFGPCGTDTAIREIQVSPNNARPRMISIPGGTYIMGDVLQDNERSDELPHRVTVAPFQLAESEVSFAEYDAYCQATGQPPPADEGWGRADRPVINVDWYDAILYCNWLSAQAGYDPVYRIDSSRTDPNNNISTDGKKWLISVNWSANGFRLPTEAEWEYAARQAGDTIRFGNGRDTAVVEEINFYGDSSRYSKAGSRQGKTISVRSLRPNALGLYHMSGNVYEWCWDWYGTYPGGPVNNPRGANSGTVRVLRGGSWGDDADYCRVANRYRRRPDDRYSVFGFRLARSL